MTDKLRQAAQQMLEAVADLTILTPREWQAVHGLKIDALRAALAAQPAEQEPFTVLVRKHSWRPNQWEAAPCGFPDYGKQWADERINVYTAPQPAKPAEQEPVEVSPEFTDTARAALLWVLWHHQGGSSPVGQPIRFALGMGAHDRLNEREIAWAVRWAAKTGATTSDFHTPQPVKREQAVEQEPTTHKLVLKSVHELAAELYAQHPTYRGTKPLAWVEVRHTVRREWLDKASAMLAAYERKNGIGGQV